MLNVDDIMEYRKVLITKEVLYQFMKQCAKCPCPAEYDKYIDCINGLEPEQAIDPGGTTPPITMNI